MLLDQPVLVRHKAASWWSGVRRLRVAWLPDGKRLHLKNGPVNVIIRAFGRPGEIGRAYDAAIERARALMLELAEDLPRLHDGMAVETPAARRAVAAVDGVPGALSAVTALTGAVADEILAAMTQGGHLERGFANNHGTVALHLADGQGITTDVLDWPDYKRYESKIPIISGNRTRGLAGGGWLYDAFALGCVERIFVAAPNAAVAGAGLGAIAARMVPPQGAPAASACALEPQSLLGGLKVFPPMTALSADMVAAVMALGQEKAAALFDDGIITVALLSLGKVDFLAAPPHLGLRALLGLAD